MLKVFGFVVRNPRITHDEYRTGHVGYHNSFGRRLPNIRGYLLNVRANRAIEESLGADCLQTITLHEPSGFDEQWDGWGQLMFDSMDHYLAARSPAEDRAGPGGLGLDPQVAEVGGDFDYLYGGSPFQFHVDEHVAARVARPERKLFKLAHFFKRDEAIAPELFRAYLTGRYAELLKPMPGLRGMVMNLRTRVDVMTGFFKPDAEGFTPAGIERRAKFYDTFDGIVEYWLDDPHCFSEARRLGPNVRELLEMDQQLFARSFFREVDETVAVLPNRSPAPDFYFR
jgi:hypothetical protein